MINNVSAILTAAGESTRMGTPKSILPWDKVPLIKFQINCLVESGVLEVIVVLGHQANNIIQYINCDKAQYVINPDYRLGKATSIKKGLSRVDPHADAILLLAVDQPRTTRVISEVIQSHIKENALITSPRFHGRGGHPLIFSGSLRNSLENISDTSQGIRKVFTSHRHAVNEVELNNPIICLDLNTLSDYETAKKKYLT